MIFYRNVGAISYAICNPIKEHQSAEQSRDVEQGRDSDISICDDGAMAAAQTASERSPLLVQPQAETGNDLPDWTAFLTSTPMQPKQQPASSSASSSTTASQDALHSISISRTRQLFALSTMTTHPTAELATGFKNLIRQIDSTELNRNIYLIGRATLRDLDTPASNSSSSSTTDSTECEAVRLLPLPPRVLPQSLPLRSPPTLTTSVSSSVSNSSLPQPQGIN